MHLHLHVRVVVAAAAGWPAGVAVRQAFQGTLARRSKTRPSTPENNQQ